MKTEVNLAGIVMKNPVMPASGTFGYGREYSEFFDLSLLGALVTKGVSPEPIEGNKTPRMAETCYGLINSIGLQNPGVEHFLEDAVPFLERYEVPVIVNIFGRTVEDYVKVAEELSKSKRVNGLEINISCPNVKSGGLVFGTDPCATKDIVQAIRNSTSLPLIVKLSPNVANIVGIAQAAYEGKADALSMINTLLGMDINPITGEPQIHGAMDTKKGIGMYMGGLSGPAILPVGLRCVYQVYRAGIPLPIIGMGGITNGNDAIKYIRAGATAVAVGTATFSNPLACVDIIKGIEDFMTKYHIEDINELRGKIKNL